MNGEIEDYFNAGMLDKLQRPQMFMKLMEDRKPNLFEYYFAGIQQLEQWYDDKAYRNYEAWFEVLDFLLIQAENHFMGRFGKE